MPTAGISVSAATPNSLPHEERATMENVMAAPGSADQW
ncbi:hypothetical protein X907_1808 [Glycocaulis alkaliphilus]|uniref:Uncharacterized protein n=1 Tax=Glycocaulis alkaliphilus TaxID=1434191 RepID=A0A3T0EAJ2_9PROT|nr:hypothetical protein X907_1808 [Glycocaulis alkaliphilus]